MAGEKSQKIKKKKNGRESNISTSTATCYRASILENSESRETNWAVPGGGEGEEGEVQKEWRSSLPDEG